MTVQIQIERKCPYWILQTIDENGNYKTVGGDEFYITYTDDYAIHTQPSYYQTIDPKLLPEKYKHKVSVLVSSLLEASGSTTTNPTTSNNVTNVPNAATDEATPTTTSSLLSSHPTAIADITDYNNGTYKLEFITSPLNERLHRLNGSGYVIVEFQYICGIGTLNPPIRNHFLSTPIGSSSNSIGGSSTGYMNSNNNNQDGGTNSTSRLMAIHVTTLPPLTIFRPSPTSIQNQQQRERRSRNDNDATTATMSNAYDGLVLSSPTGDDNNDERQQQQQQQTIVDVDLSKYKIIPIGDSLMQHFVISRNHDIKNAPQNVGQPLNTTTVPHFIERIESQLTPQLLQKMKTQKRHNKTGGGSPPLALLLGSSTWDLLSNDGRPPPTPQPLPNGTSTYSTNSKNNRGYSEFDYEYHIAQNDMYWDDHLVACEQLIQHIRTTYPGIVEEIFWKSPSSLHIHVPILQLQMEDAATSLKLRKQYGGLTKLHNRLRYMSSSRANLLHTKQQQLMKRLNVTYLDVYQATYLSADHTYIGDGRHYLPYLNTMILNWFYPTSSYIEAIWDYYRSMHDHDDDVDDDSHLRNHDKDDRYFLLGYYSCPIIPRSTTTSNSNDYRVNDEEVAVDLVNSYIVAMVLNRTLLLKYHDSSLGESKQILLSEEDCNHRIWNQAKPPSWINMYDDWISLSSTPPPLFNVRSLPSPPKSHHGLSNRDRWLVPVRSSIPMGISELLSAGYDKSILVINDMFEQDGQNMFHGMLMNKLFASPSSLPTESTARKEDTPIPNGKIESSDAITIAISPSLTFDAGMNETKLADCLQKLLKDSGLHGHMKCSVLVHPSTFNQHLQNLINDRFKCTTIAVPPISSDDLTTTPRHNGNPRSSKESTISFAERFSFYQRAANTIYDGYIEYDCNSGESMVMQRLVHYLRDTEARRHGQLPITDIPYCCFQN